MSGHETNLRVLMLGWESPDAITGGLGVASGGLAEALARRVSVRFVTPRGGGGDPYPSGAGEEGYAGDLLARVDEFANGLGDACGFGLIHAHDWLTFPAAMRLKARSGRPFVAHVHSLERDRAGANGWERIRGIEREGLQAADRVIAVSRRTAAACSDEYGLPREKIVVVPNGVAPVTPWSERTGEERVVFLGRMTGQKAPEVFVDMAARVGEVMPEARFTMAGSGEMLEDLRRLAAEFGLCGRLDFPGFLAREEVRRLLARSTVCCMTSRSEPFGLAALEAAQFGVPSVVSAGSGVAEVLHSARTAITAHDFARVVTGLLRDSRQRHQLGEQARREAAGLTWDLAAERVLVAYPV